MINDGKIARWLFFYYFSLITSKNDIILTKNFLFLPKGTQTFNHFYAFEHFQWFHPCFLFLPLFPLSHTFIIISFSASFDSFFNIIFIYISACTLILTSFHMSLLTSSFILLTPSRHISLSSSLLYIHFFLNIYQFLQLFLHYQFFSSLLFANLYPLHESWSPEFPHYNHTVSSPSEIKNYHYYRLIYLSSSWLSKPQCFSFFWHKELSLLYNNSFKLVSSSCLL